MFLADAGCDGACKDPDRLRFSPIGFEMGLFRGENG